MQLDIDESTIGQENSVDKENNKEHGENDKESEEETEAVQLAFILFEKEQAAKTACLLSVNGV